MRIVVAYVGFRFWRNSWLPVEITAVTENSITCAAIGTDRTELIPYKFPDYRVTPLTGKDTRIYHPKQLAKGVTNEREVQEEA